MMHCRAFTLVEMLVVMSIIAMLSGLIFVAYDQSEVDVVTADAYELQTVLQRARTKAISTGKTHAVAFHIENAGDGTVLRNRSNSDDEDFPGRHWYCIIGPDNADRKLNQYVGRKSDKPPIAGRNGEYKYNFFALEDYVEAVKAAQAGPRHYLSSGVRFLALSDEDRLHSYDKHETYPRPWFGYYDDVSQTLYPWGAYNREIDATFKYPNTGLDYEGVDGPIPYDAGLDTNVNPPEVWARVHYDEVSRTGAIMQWSGQTGNATSIHTHYGFKADYVGPDTTHLPGKARPLINGYWCDYMILFNPKGEAFSAAGKARATYMNKRKWGRLQPQGRREMELRDYAGLTGGFYITLCRDVDPEDRVMYRQTSPITGDLSYNKFTSVEQAFDSITPFLRVYVNKITGKAEVRNNEHPGMRITPADMLQQKPYPRGF